MCILAVQGTALKLYAAGVDATTFPNATSEHLKGHVQRITCIFFFFSADELDSSTLKISLIIYETPFYRFVHRDRRHWPNRTSTAFGTDCKLEFHDCSPHG